ncbi:MAG TPA: DUF3185 family protein [Acidobacteriaceae bacterium]
MIIRYQSIAEFKLIFVMNRMIALALVVGGIVLLVLGYHAAHSTSSYVSHVFTGSPTNKSIWMLTAGAIAVAVGLAGLSKK